MVVPFFYWVDIHAYVFVFFQISDVSHFFLTNGFLAFSVKDIYQLNYCSYQTLQCTANYLITFWGFCCVIISFYVPSSALCCPLQFPHTNDVRFVFTTSCLYECSCLYYVICACLRIEVSNAYCVLFFFVLCTLCCLFLWIVHFWLSRRCSLTFI